MKTKERTTAERPKKRENDTEQCTKTERRMTEKTDNGLFSYQKKQNEYVTKTNLFKTRH